MPFQYENKVAVTKDELSPWYKPESLSVMLTRNKKKPFGMQRLTTGRNGSQLLVDFDTLPKEIQEALGDPRKCDHILERFYKRDGAAVNFYATYRPEGSIIPLDLDKQERYINNASVLKAALALKEAREIERKSKGGSLRGIPTTVWEDVMSFTETLRVKFKTEHTLPENERRFIEVMNKFEKEGFTSIINKNEGNVKALKVTDEVLDLLKNIFAGQKKKPTATDVYRTYDSFINGYTEVRNLVTGEIYDRSQFKPLSDTTVKRYMASWDVKIGAYPLRSTDRQKIMQQFKPHHSWEKEKFAGSIISIDDRQPPFKALNGKRVWFYNGVDLGSGAFTCFVWAESKEELIIKFYTQLVRNHISWGIPLPYEVECEMSLNSGLRDTILQEGVMFQRVTMEANNARGKRIERYFGKLRYNIEKDREGWLARPHARRESNQPAVDLAKVPMLPFDDIVENALQDIEDWNNQAHHVHTHMSRWEVFCNMQNPKLQPTDYSKILRYIGRPTETSCNVGIVRLNYGLCLLGINGRVALGGNLVALMKRLEGKTIMVYWIDDNEGRMLRAAAYLDNQYICDIVHQPKYVKAELEKTELDYENEKIMSSYTNTMDSYSRRQQKAIDEVFTIDHTPAKPKTFTIAAISRRLDTSEWTEPNVLPPLPDEETEFPIPDTDSTAESTELADRY